MKKYFYLLFILVLSNSCVSYPYKKDTENNQFHKIKAGNVYTFFHSKDSKTKMEVTSVAFDSIHGKNKKAKLSIAKNDIQKIRKSKPGATVVLVGGVVGTFVVSAALAKALQEVGEDVAEALPPL